MLSLVKFVLGDSNWSWYASVSVCVCVSQRWNMLTLPRHFSESLVTAVTHPRWKEGEKKNRSHSTVWYCSQTHRHVQTHTRTHFHIYQPHEMSYSDETLHRLKMLNSHLIKRVFAFTPSKEGKARFDKSDMWADRERWELNLSVQEKKKQLFSQME